MFNLKRLLLFVILLCATSQANAQSSLLLGLLVNPICSLAANLKNPDQFDPTPYANSNGFLCSEDSVFGNVAATFGTEGPDIAPIKPLLADMGFTAVYPENMAVSSLNTSILTGVLWILGVAVGYMFMMFLKDLVKSGSFLETLSKYPLRLVTILIASYFVAFGGTTIMYFVALPLFVGNGQITGRIDSAISTGKLANKLEPDETFMLSANSASQIFMEAEENVSTMALFIMNKYRMTKVEGAVYGSNDITKDEAIEEVIKQAKADIALSKSLKVNADATMNIGNIINVYNLGLRYKITKKADYDMEYRNIYGFPVTYGTVEIGGSGSNVEQLAGGESLNDGTVGKQLNNTRIQASETLGPQYLPMIETKRIELLDEMNKGNFVSNSMTIDTKIREKISLATRTLLKNNIVYEQLHINSPATFDIIKGVGGANVFSGMRGHDGTSDGQAIRAQKEWLRKHVVLKLRNAVCSENWSAYKKEREEIKKFNAIPGETPMNDLSRNGKIAELTGGCADLNLEAHKIEALGSENLVDLEQFKKEALAAKIAKDVVDASIFMGIKDALNSDDEHDNALKYSMYLKAKEGLTGLALADLELSNYQNAQKVKTRALSDSLYFTFNNAGIKNYNFVNMELLYGKADINTSSDEFQRVSDGFPVLPFNMLMISSVTNVAPSSLTDDSAAKSSFNVAKVVGDLVSLELNSVKLMGGMDLAKSSFDGATECKNDPTVCEKNSTMSYEAGMRLMGQENLDYAMKVIAINKISSALIEAKDMAGEVLETVTAGLGSTKMATFAKYALSAGATIFLMSMYGAKVISDGLMPIAYINMGLGLFCMYFLPIVKLLIMVGVVIGFGWQVALLKMFYAPWLLLRALTAGSDDECGGYLKQLMMLVFRAAVAIPVFIAVYNFLGFMLDAFVPRRIIWSILTMGDGSLVSQIFASGMVSIALLWIYFQYINAMKKTHEEIMEALTGNSNGFDDNAYDKVKSIMENPNLINGMQQATAQVSNAPLTVIDIMKKENGRNKKLLDDYRKQFGNIPQDSGGKDKRS